jgi:ribosomal-protein-alanine N-acetyltransferase
MNLPDLRTKRLCLRAFRKDDVEDALEYRKDAEFARYLPHVPYPFTRADAERFVEVNMSEDGQRSPTFAIVMTERLIGTVNFEVDDATRTAMLGYAIGRQWWGRGIAVEAAVAAVAWSVAEFHLKRIWAATDVQNVRSQRVLEKLGMQREGVRVASRAGRGGSVIDEVVYSLNFRDDGTSA